MTEGYIKFRLEWLKSDAVTYEMLKEINPARTELFDMGFIGIDDEGYGFGNISVRQSGNKFLISGSRTGGIRILEPRHYAIVMDFNIAENFVQCRGEIEASSESLSHAAIYAALPEIKSVIHIHNQRLWQKFLHILPATSLSAEYGTPKLADEIRRILVQTEKQNQRIFILGGHPDGLISYGRSIFEAYKEIIEINSVGI